MVQKIAEPTAANVALNQDVQDVKLLRAANAPLEARVQELVDSPAPAAAVDLGDEFDGLRQRLREAEQRCRNLRHGCEKSPAARD